MVSSVPADNGWSDLELDDPSQDVIGYRITGPSGSSWVETESEAFEFGAGLEGSPAVRNVILPS
jgi:hypothetical protein